MKRSIQYVSFIIVPLVSLFIKEVFTYASYVGYTTGDVNFRKKATTSSGVYLEIPKNTKVDVLDTNPVSGSGCGYGWIKISYDGKTGYVCSSYLYVNGADAYNRPWTSPKRAIVGGAKFVGASYIKVGQYTSYLKKFNVTGSNLYSHQYMGNVRAPWSEALTSFNAYTNAGIIDSALVFSIPIYNNMNDYYSLEDGTENLTGLDTVEDQEFEAKLDEQGFPESYKRRLRYIHKLHPTWQFEGIKTNLNFADVIEGEYDIFPVFRKYSSRAQEIVTTFPKYTKNGVEYPVFFHFGLDSENVEKEFTTSDWFNGALYDASETPSAAYIAIHNGNSGTGVSLYKGALETAATTSTGGKTINTGKTLTFEVPMTSLGNNRYSTTATVSGWKIGTSMNKVSIDTLEVKAGKMYYIELSGSNYLDLEAKWKTVEGSSEILAEDTGFEDEESTIFR